MVRVSFKTLELAKLYPLAISRGSSSSSENLFVLASDGAHTGIGELAPATSSEWTATRGEEQLRRFAAEGISHGPAETWARMREQEIDPPAMAALDIALWDLLGKQAGLPLWRLLGLSPRQACTSVTIGINPPEVVRERVPDILRRTGAKALKIKLGSPEGIDADCRSFEATLSVSSGVALRVDANGGWSVSDASFMLKWLAERGVEYVEQPLVEGAEDLLPSLFEGRPLPIFVDESCRFSPDVPRLAGRADGVNVKLMKCGGLTEAVRLVATARAHGMQTMIGCMSESSVGIAAGAAIGALFDHIDLDSHLNLAPDPADGAPIVDGCIVPSDRPGHGASLADA